MRVLKYVGFVAISVAFAAGASFAQETETKVIDEVVAQVNDGVITLSGIRREMKEIVDSKVQEGMKREDAEKFVAEMGGSRVVDPRVVAIWMFFKHFCRECPKSY